MRLRVHNITNLLNFILKPNFCNRTRRYFFDSTRWVYWFYSQAELTICSKQRYAGSIEPILYARTIRQCVSDVKSVSHTCLCTRPIQEDYRTHVVSILSFLWSLYRQKYICVWWPLLLLVICSARRNTRVAHKQSFWNDCTVNQRRGHKKNKKAV